MHKSFYFSLIFVSFFACIPLSAQDQAPETEEVLFVRRIMEFWKDNENQIVESQIKQFVAHYPNSEFVESLQAILGDSLRTEKKYANALKAYEAIRSPELMEKVFAHRMDCLYHLEQYQALAEEILPRLPKNSNAVLTPEERLWTFYFAESLLQRGKRSAGFDEARKYYEQARPYFTNLVDSEHRLNAKLALAEVAVAMGDCQYASDIYLELAESNPEKKEEVLFYAARVQSSFDPKQALFLFSYVQGLGGSYAADAAMNKAVLMYEQGHYSQLINESQGLRQVVVFEKQPSLDLFIGQSHFALKQYEEAERVLRPLLMRDVLTKSNEKKVLLLVMASAYHMNDLSKIQALKVHFNISFPKDPAFAHILYLEALTLKNEDHFQEAQANLEDILKNYPSFEKREAVEFEHALLLFKQGRWLESRGQLMAFLQKHPSSRHYIQALEYVPQATLKHLESLNAEDEARNFLYEQLVGDLQLLLNTPDATKPLQRPKILLRLCNTLYEMKRYDAALAELKAYIQNYPHDESLFQAHLLSAMCYQEGSDDGSNFAYHVERVLQLKPDSLTMHRLRKSLFSAYMQLAHLQDEKKADPSPYFVQAAEHLFILIKKDKEQVTQELQMWLASYYYDKSRGCLNEYAIEPVQDPSQIEIVEKAIDIYQLALQIGPQTVVPTITKDHLYMEQELYKLSNLYGWLKNSSRQIEILKSLVNQQNDNPGWEWNLRSRVYFTLAYALQQLNEIGQAKEIYFHLITTLKTSDPYVLNASKLQLARLSFESLPPAKKNLDDPELMALLKELKDLQIRKTLAYEPVHLEAGLEYAQIRTSLEPKRKQAEQMHFLLTRMKKEFISQDDLASKDYHLSRQNLPGQDLIYQAYMMYIDATLARLEAERAGNNGKLAEKHHKDEAAKSIYTNLIKGKFAVSKYLVHQARLGLEALDASNGIASRGK